MTWSNLACQRCSSSSDHAVVESLVKEVSRWQKDGNYETYSQEAEPVPKIMETLTITLIYATMKLVTTEGLGEASIRSNIKHFCFGSAEAVAE